MKPRCPLSGHKLLSLNNENNLLNLNNSIKKMHVSELLPPVSYQKDNDRIMKKPKVCVSNFMAEGLIRHLLITQIVKLLACMEHQVSLLWAKAHHLDCNLSYLVRFMTLKPIFLWFILTFSSISQSVTLIFRVMTDAGL
jgi:hypothetical protein